MGRDPSADYRVEGPEVLYATADVVTVDLRAIGDFKQLSHQNPRRRVRLCAHGGPGDLLHEMLIVHERGAYIRPHKHPGKMESTHVIEGLVDIVLFDDHGGILRTTRMGDYASGRPFYHRTATPVFHTLIIRSYVLVFHETTEGPFRREDTVFAPWAPAEGDVQSIVAYMAGLDKLIRGDE